MNNSTLNSLNVPAVGGVTGAQAPATLYKAAAVAVRMVVTNIGGNTIFLAHDPSTLSNSPVFAGTYQLQKAAQLVVVLAPGQGLYAAGLGAGGEVSIACSEALPVAE